jgi:hypothetical protein
MLNRQNKAKWYHNDRTDPTEGMHARTPLETNSRGGNCCMKTRKKKRKKNTKGK